MKTENNIIISFVIPVYNMELYIKECVESIINSNVQNIEIILIDNCSTDSSGQICDEYRNRYNNIKVVHNKENMGVAFSKNVGIDTATGNYIFFIDSDDWIDSKKLKNLICVLEETNVDMVINKYVIYTKENSSFGNNNLDEKRINNKSQKDFLDYIRKERKNIMAQWEYVVKRKVLIENNIHFNTDETGIDDMYFTPTLLCNCNSFYMSKDIIYFWRQRPDSQGKTHKKHDYIIKLIRTIKSMEGYIEKLSNDHAIKFMYYSIYKSIYALFGEYNKQSNEDKAIIRKWYSLNKYLIKRSVQYSGFVHKLLHILFGNYYGIIISYKIAVCKGKFYLWFYKNN